MDNRIKLHLGCGQKLYDGFINVDKFNYNNGKKKTDHVVDFEHDKLPLEDNSVDYIFCHHVLEHLRDCQHILNECWRVLKPDGIIHICVPHGLWSGASKPVHFQVMTASWFQFLKRDNIWEWYGYRSWDIKYLHEKINKDDIPYEVICRMSPRK